jgi:hypothetical protein
MTIRKFAFGGAVALASLFAVSPVLAFTHHPATPAEIKQTDELNAQSLVQAKGAEGTTMNASSGTVSGGMNTGASMNVGGVDENGQANVTTPKNDKTRPAKTNPDNSDHPNGQ